MKLKWMVVAAMIAASSLSGCAVSSTRVSQGSSFAVDRLLEVKPGMPKQAVRQLLGAPYAVGMDLDGNEFYDYQFAVASNSGVGAGIIVSGYTGTTSTSGATAHVVFDRETGGVRFVQYEVAGQDNYEKFAMGRKTQ